jgi:hypothetical protein
VQSWTRLDEPSRAPRPRDKITVDDLRRGAVSYGHKIARAGEEFTRHCREADAKPATHASGERNLGEWLRVAVQTAKHARGRLCGLNPDDPVEVGEERKLVDEYVSVRVLEALASAERAVQDHRALVPSPCPRRAAQLAEFECSLATVLEGEIAHRAAQGWPVIDPSSPLSLERYLDRASRLKKHFQEVLFLEAHSYQVAERFHNCFAAVVAVLASTWAVVVQRVLTNHARTVSEQLGSGLFALAALAGFVYAIKDRIKELGRAWLSGKVHRLYAQRVVRWRAPAKRGLGRNSLVRARESFLQSTVRRPDPLNPCSGADTTVTIMRYVHRGVIYANPKLASGGVSRVKHIFRYDLSPIFTRLADPVKEIPLLDAASRKVTCTPAPRYYRLPVRLGVRLREAGCDLVGSVMVSKQGLDRFEPEDAEAPPEDGSSLRLRNPPSSPGIRTRGAGYRVIRSAPDPGRLATEAQRRSGAVTGPRNR